jgi:hypothetical protein
MKRLFGAVCTFAVAAVLAGCGSATDNVDFKVPDGYQSKVNMFGMQVWTKGADNNDQTAIMLMKLPVKMDPKNFQMPDLNSAGLKNSKVTAEKTTTICGDQPAVIASMTGTSNANKDESVDMVVTGAGGATYMAMYMRPAGSAPDADAQHAINNVCAKK